MTEKDKKIKSAVMQIKRTVKKVIDDWDPAELLSFCPDDEYDFETDKIGNFLISNIKTIDENVLGKEIESFFRGYFRSNNFDNNIGESRKAAKKILDNIDIINFLKLFGDNSN